MPLTLQTLPKDIQINVIRICFLVIKFYVLRIMFGIFMFTGEQFSNELKRVRENVAHFSWGRGEKWNECACFLI